MAFTPQGLTVNLAVTGSAQTLAVAPGGVAAHTVRLANIGSQTVFILFDNATTVTVSNGAAVLANSVETFSVGVATSIQAIAAAVGSTIYATAGFGE